MVRDKRRNFMQYFKNIASSAIVYIDDSPYELIVKLSDGTTVSYNDLNCTLRTLPNDCMCMTEEECKREFGIRLHAIMAYEGVTQQELSERTNIDQSAISKYITGKVMPSLFTADKIAKALGWTIDAFTYNK